MYILIRIKLTNINNVKVDIGIRVFLNFRVKIFIKLYYII